MSNTINAINIIAGDAAIIESLAAAQNENAATADTAPTTTINLRDFYPWLTQDEFVEVSAEIAAELFADKRYSKTHERTIRRNKVLSLDAADGTEAAASACNTDNPEAIFEMMERHCRLCCALNSLPEAQGRRVEAYYLLGKSQQEIADAEGVSKMAVSTSIAKGIAAMKIFYENFDSGVYFCSKNVLIGER